MIAPTRVTLEDVFALLAVRHSAWENEMDFALLAPGRGKYGHVECADLGQRPSLTGGQFGPIGEQARAVFPRQKTMGHGVVRGK